MTVEYNDDLSHEDQVDAEEGIAHIIHAFEYGENAEMRPSEEDCAELGRQILLFVLEKFRPDLVDGGEEPVAEESEGGSFECKRCETEFHFPAEEYTPEEVDDQLAQHLCDAHDINLSTSAFESERSHYFKRINS
jgi:hypothetical protein